MNDCDTQSLGDGELYDVTVSVSATSSRQSRVDVMSGRLGLREATLVWSLVAASDQAAWMDVLKAFVRGQIGPSFSDAKSLEPKLPQATKQFLSREDFSALAHHVSPGANPALVSRSFNSLARYMADRWYNEDPIRWSDHGPLLRAGALVAFRKQENLKQWLDQAYGSELHDVYGIGEKSVSLIHDVIELL